MMQNKSLPLIILTVIILLLAVCAVRPLFLSIKQNSETLIAQKGTLAELEKRSENIKKFQLTYDIYQTNFKKIDQLFVDGEEPVDFIEFLEKEAARIKLAVDLTPINLKAGENDFWPSIGFQVDAAGSFQNFLKFLNKIEASPYLIALSDFSLNKPAKNTDGDIVVSFQMKIYIK